MAAEPFAPVVIGVAQVVERRAAYDPAVSPGALMAAAVLGAWADAGVPMPRRIPSLRAVPALVEHPGNPGGVVADALGLDVAEIGLATVGGNGPQALVNRTSAQIAAGQLDLAVLVGAEARRTLSLARRAGQRPPWPRGEGRPVALGDEVPLLSPADIGRGIVLPVQLYALFESAVRAAQGTSPAEHLVRISELWSRFAGVSAANPYAWLGGARSAEEIRTPSASNRMIGLPYTKLMNANNDVDLGAAVIVASAARAASLGVPRDRWVFVHAGTDAHEHPFVSARAGYAEAPAIRRAGRLAGELAGVALDEIELVDLYSCFPSAVQVGAAELGLGLDRQLTRTGGLTFAGGPGNNYSMHAVATIVGELRAGAGRNALVWANGGYLTKHSFGVYGTTPPPAGFRHANPQAEIDTLERVGLASPAEAAGPATVEAYTVMHDAQQRPAQLIAACRLADGRRAWGTSSDTAEAAEWCSGERVGTAVTLDAQGVVRAAG